jgi:type VI secretion system secreted protein VgrG
MPSYSQANRLISIDTPLGEDKLLLQGFSGHEGVSRLFEFDLDLFSEDQEIPFGDIVGRPVTFAVRLADGGSRHFNGVVSRFAQSGMDVRFTHYRMQVVPWLWLLTRNANCRIFQNMTIPQIIENVFTKGGFRDFRLSLTATYEPREYCVQYRETDFNFVSRLMEQYGIFYFFEHENGKHTLVLGDSPSVHEDCPGQKIAQYNQASGDLDVEDVIISWAAEQEMRTGSCALNDYNFTTPATSLLATDNTLVDVGGNTKFEIYDYPGQYPTPSQGKSLVKIRMEEQEATHLVAAGSSVCRAFTAGYTFEMAEHYRGDTNIKYLLTEVQHVASEGGSYSLAGGTSGETYSNRFRCIPASFPYRPARITPRPFVQGPQTALVVGKAGEEIWTDSYGRVTVQFYWDREGKKNENSSCWIRVSQPWAGKNWGAMWVPRIGQEVIVSFLEGDPDRPIISGRVYNAEQSVPYTLPDKQTVSTFKSRSSKQGDSNRYNEIRFEDKTGSEQIFINAEKDMDLRVEQESREHIGANRHLIVAASTFADVAGDKHSRVKGKQNEKIDGDMSLQIAGKQMEKTAGDQSIEVVGNHKEKIGGTASLQVMGDQKEDVTGGVSLKVGMSRDTKIGQTDAVEAGAIIHLKAGMTVIIEAGVQLSLKGPGGFIDIGPAGVTIQGTMVLINSGGAAGNGPGANPQSPASPDAPVDPTAPDVADDGTKFTKM